jgi:hypothetical protein
MTVPAAERPYGLPLTEEPRYDAQPVTSPSFEDGATLGYPVSAEPLSAPFEGDSSTTDAAKDEAVNVKDAAVDAGKSVAATAKEEAANVVTETKDQAQSLLASVSSQVKDQAVTQQSKLAETVHAWSKELGGMASKSEESGPLTDLAHQASRKVGEVAHFLENNEPTAVLAEVTAFARRRPVMFLALCAVAGVVAGRITRSAVAVNTSVDSPSEPASAGHRMLEVTPPNGVVSSPVPAYSAQSEVVTSYDGFGASEHADTAAPLYGQPNASSEYSR